MMYDEYFDFFFVYISYFMVYLFKVLFIFWNVICDIKINICLYDMGYGGRKLGILDCNV